MGEVLAAHRYKKIVWSFKRSKKMSFFFHNDSDLALRLSTSISFHIYRLVRDEA
jgi:hypothetical protein